MNSTAMLLDCRLEQYRQYLRLLAELQVPPRFQTLLDPSEMAAQTLVKANRHLPQCQTDLQFAAWLRRMLAHTIADNAHQLHAELVSRHDLASRIDEAAARLEAWLIGLPSSQSEQAAPHSVVLRLAVALDRLPDNERHAVEWHYLKGCSVAEIAFLLRCSEVDVAALVRGGLAKLREQLV